MTEYPKHVYPGGDLEQPSRLVTNPDEEAAARADGYEAITSVLPEDLSPAAVALGSAFIEYPKHVYPGGDLEQPSRIVKNAAEERAACLEGYAPLSIGTPATVADAAGDEQPERADEHHTARRSKRAK